MLVEIHFGGKDQSWHKSSLRVMEKKHSLDSVQLQTSYKQRRIRRGLEGRVNTDINIKL